jgi:anthranilate phosphoribosyltransferase
VARETFAGRKGPVRDMVLLNAAALITAYDGTPTPGELTARLRDAYDRAAAAVDSGAASALLDRWIETSQGLRP